ncbi:glycoside hydrolase [Mycena olivaceomarginata]|nr:glycoside hydrolase [Mycena olivaceomarginata]
MLEEVTLGTCDIPARDGVLLDLKFFSMSNTPRRRRRRTNDLSEKSLGLVSAGRLQSLKIDGLDDTIPLMTGFGGQRFPHLTQLSLDTIFDLSFFLRFLTQCPRLQILSAGHDGSPSLSSHVHPETIPLLRSIDAPLDLVRALTPNRPVRDVIVQPGYSLSAEDFTLAVLDISNASVPVQSLTLPSTYLPTVESLNTMSSLFPGLTSLSMEIRCEEPVLASITMCGTGRSSGRSLPPEYQTPELPDVCDAGAFDSLPPEEVSDTEEEQPSPAVRVALETHPKMPDFVLLHKVLSNASKSTELSVEHQHQVIAALSRMYPSLRELEMGHHNNPHWERNGALWKRKGVNSYIRRRLLLAPNAQSLRPPLPLVGPPPPLPAGRLGLLHPVNTGPAPLPFPPRQISAPRERPPPAAHKPRTPGDLWAGRANEVRKAFAHAYRGYQARALPYDELLPVSGDRVNNFHGWGRVDDMFYDTVEDVAGETWDMAADAPHAHFFEVTIRYLGGLLSAYALSHDPRLLRLADDLGEKLLPAFNTQSGWPVWGVNTRTGATTYEGQDVTCLAEALSNQMEFKYLAHLTGKARYFAASERPLRAVYGPENTAHGGLLATMWDLRAGTPNGTEGEAEYTAAGCADSAYEYFLKQWLMTGQKEGKIRDLYIRSANAIIENLLYVAPRRQLLYATDLRAGAPTHRVQHLSCFLPGVFALGVHARARAPVSASAQEGHAAPGPALDLSDRDRTMHRWAAHGLAHTCWALYADTASGLSPDKVAVAPWGVPARGRWAERVREWEGAQRTALGPGGKGDWGWGGAGAEGPVPPGVGGLERVGLEREKERGYKATKDAYLLRPETVETFYIMWRTTGDVRWRERGWAVFQSIEANTKAQYGYSSVQYVDDRVYKPRKSDDQPSWFLAETLKYLFLLFTDEDLVPLDKWVFNTEAHPLPVFEWSQREIEEFGIEVV